MGQRCATQAGACLPCEIVQPERKFAWKPDAPDSRDRVLRYDRQWMSNLPAKVDLRPREHFPIYDQGSVGSCTANALGAAFHYAMVQQGLTNFLPSRLFLYFNERWMEGHVFTDTGSSLRTGVKSLCEHGICSEAAWPYVESKVMTQPSREAYEMAADHQAIEYARIPHTLDDMKAVLAAGFPFAFGMMLFSSFMSPFVSATGRVTMPWGCCDRIIGGHAVLAVGYDDEREVFIVRNSWGHRWGDGGYFYVPYEYMAASALVQDLWAVKAVEGWPFPTVNKKVTKAAGSCQWVCGRRPFLELVA